MPHDTALITTIAAGLGVMGERELALGMAHYALLSLGRTDDEADAAVGALREAARTPA